jgi:hypothetical protein
MRHEEFFRLLAGFRDTFTTLTIVTVDSDTNRTFFTGNPNMKTHHEKPNPETIEFKEFTTVC